jgi:hypothetical protein
MPSIAVDRLEWDDRNIDHIWEHGLDPDTVDEILESAYVVVWNRRQQTAPYLLIGLDYNGRCIAAPIVRGRREGVWRPLSAWYCKPAEWARWRQQRRR